MAESIKIVAEAGKEEKYRSLLPQLAALTTGEDDLVANLANITAALKQTFNFLWIGFYFVKGNELVLGPFQGPVACTRIGFGKGVCGTSWKENKTIIVPDVDLFPGHIACSTASKSEIVIPVRKDGKVWLIMDIDSDVLNDFDETDKNHLEKIAALIENFSLITD